MHELRTNAAERPFESVVSRARSVRNQKACNTKEFHSAISVGVALVTSTCTCGVQVDCYLAPNLIRTDFLIVLISILSLLMIYCINSYVTIHSSCVNVSTWSCPLTQMQPIILGFRIVGNQQEHKMMWKGLDITGKH